MMSRRLPLSLWHISTIVVGSVIIGMFVEIYIDSFSYSETNTQTPALVHTVAYTQPVYKPLVGLKGVELESDMSLMDRKYAKPYALHRRSREVETIGDRYIYYLGYCGSGCQRFVVVNIANGKVAEGVLSYMNYGENRREWHVLFDDWHGDTHRFDGELAKIVPSLEEKDVVFSFRMKKIQEGSLREYTVSYPLSDFE